jgi:proteasome activator subunit 4
MPNIRRSFVNILKTPSLLAMFSKDPLSMSYSQGALRSLAMLEPSIIMPELLERAYGGLEVVNETHRTTAVLSMLSGIARPLVSEELWLGGQKHIVPLLELCIPGIDLVRSLFVIRTRYLSSPSTERPRQDCVFHDVHRLRRTTHKDW